VPDKRQIPSKAQSNGADLEEEVLQAPTQESEEEEWERYKTQNIYEIILKQEQPHHPPAAKQLQEAYPQVRPRF
jgi:hypothetical protein